MPMLMNRKLKHISSIFALTGALAILTALGAACDGGSEAVLTQPVSEREKVAAVIGWQLAQLRQVKGREGILAEKRRYSLYDEELIIRDFFQDRRDGFFVDVGCAWPIDANNTYYLEKHLGWKGIGIDALEEYGPDWRAIRPNSMFFSYLVTDRSGIKQTFFQSPNTGLSSTNRKRASGIAFGAHYEPKEIELQTITLTDLLDREGITKIDLLAMDIEGHEAQALAGFDIDRFQPTMVMIERPIEFTRGHKWAAYRYLDEHGYELIAKYVPFDPVNHYFKKKAIGDASLNSGAN